MEVDAGARESVGVGELTQPSQIRVDLGLDDGDDRMVAGRGDQLAPEAGTSRAFLPEQAEPDLLRDRRHGGPASRRVRPRHERRTRDPGVDQPSPRAAYPSSHWSSNLRKEEW